MLKGRDKINEFADQAELEIYFADGFDNAILGIAQHFNNHSVLYDYEKCVGVLMERDGMSYDEADEFMQYNVVGAWVGEGTPTFLILKS